jgi:hypothetical protein
MPWIMNEDVGYRKYHRQFSIKYLERVYDRLCIAADKLLKEYNPCKIKNNKCVGCRSLGGYGSNNTKQLCCIACKYWKENKGCTVKALSCKLWLCDSLKDKLDSNFKIKMERLIAIASWVGLTTHYRMSKKQIFESRYNKEFPHILD